MLEQSTKGTIISSLATIFGPLMADSRMNRSFPECEDDCHKNDCIRIVLEGVQDDFVLFASKIESIITLHSTEINKNKNLIEKINRKLSLINVRYDLETEQITQTGIISSEFMEKNEKIILLDKLFIPDVFYESLIDEINTTFYNKCYVASLILIRKLIENLIIDLLRKKYTNHDTKRKLFWTGKRFVFLINLIRNLELNVKDFESDSKKIDKKFIKFLHNIVRLPANASAHSIEIRLSKETLIEKKEIINQYIELLFATIKKM